VDGVDRLRLTDALDSSMLFEGRAGYHGDTRDCLDDLLTRLESDGGHDIVVLRDDLDRPQKLYHPWRSWMLVIAGFEEAGQMVDQVVYLDCRTLVQDEAVLIRELRTPAATFSDELWHFDALNAAMPRSAWVRLGPSGLYAPGFDADWALSPMPSDSAEPWVFPDDPKLLEVDWDERGMMTQVDGDVGNGVFVVAIENSGTEPLTIDPDQFRIANRPDVPGGGPDPDVAPSGADWDYGSASGMGTLAPGKRASLTLEFPSLPEPAMPTFLVYRDSSLSDGALTFDCVDNCGYGGGGSRPKVRTIR
jgi:hypothetical protein